MSEVPPPIAGSSDGDDPGRDESAAAEEDALFGDSGGTQPKQVPPLSPREKAAAQSTKTDLAIAEQNTLGSYLTPEQIEARAAEMEADRHQRFRDAFEHVAIGALYTGGITILVLAVLWALHLVLPADKRWLTPEDLTHIQTLLTAGVLVGAVSSHFKKRLGDLDKKD